MGEWRSGSAALLHGEGRRFDPYLAYQNCNGSSNLSSRTKTQRYDQTHRNSNSLFNDT